MDTDLFLQQLRELPLEEGRAYLRTHVAAIADHGSFGVLLADEALNKLFTPFVSLKIAEWLIFFGAYVEHLSSRALGLKAKGDALVQIGHYQAALECLNTAGEIFLELGDEENWARSRISGIISLARLGYVEEALQDAARARAVFLRVQGYEWVCSIDLNTAIIYDEVGRHQDAITLYEQMQTYPLATDQQSILIQRVMAMALEYQAIIVAALGDFEKALRLLQQAQERFIDLKETALIINVEVDLADLDYTQGYYGSALRRYFQARDGLMQYSLNNPVLLAEFKLRIANCLIKLNRAQEGCILANEAVASYRQVGISLSTANALREYATTLVASGRSQEALAAFEEAGTLLNNRQFASFSFTTKLQQAELLLEMGHIAEAYEQARLVQEYFTAKGLVFRAARASLLMAGALIEKAQRVDRHKDPSYIILLQEAEQLCKQVALQAHQHNLQEAVHKSHYLLGRLYTLQGNTIKAARHYSAAIAQIERILDNLAYDLSPSFLRTTWAVYEDMIALCLQQGYSERAFNYLEQARSMALRQYINKSSMGQNTTEGKGTSPLSMSMSQMNSATTLRIQRELRDVQEEYRHFSVLLAESATFPSVDQEIIQAELQRCEVKLSELFERLSLYQANTDFSARPKRKVTRQIKRIDSAQLRQKLAPGQVLLAYFLSKGKLVNFVISSERLITREQTNGVAQLELLLLQLYAHLQPGGWPNPQQPPQPIVRRLLNKLYNILIAPIVDLLPQDSGHLTIVPYGLLHELPFEALYDGTQFLIEKFQINYLPASNMLIHLENRKIGQTIEPQDGTSVRKTPLVFGYSGNGHLQRTIDEAQMVANLLEGQCYLENDATIAQLIQQAKGSPVIHIATHGHSRLDAPNFSSVLLADGQLNAIDAFSLDLKQCELVTLSGCETGKAFIGGGDEQLGLGRAFLAAGVESLVMSLWPVEDNATNALMQRFYQNLLRGDTKVQALRAAQCSMLLSSSPNDTVYSHPYFWAAFRLVGDIGLLKYRKV